MSLHLHASLLALYVGPDQLMPLASILGLIGGAVLIFWRRVVGIAQRFQTFLTKR